MSVSYTFRAGAGVAALTALAVAAGAQQPKVQGASFDRSAIPAPGKAPELHVPSWTSTRLGNGAELVVSPRHNLPLVSFTINFVGGGYNFEPADKLGVA
jgi:hypothetical protein